MQVTTLEHDGEFRVLFSEGSHWRSGVYRPRFTSAAELTELEQHSCPESFLLVAGEITMVYRDESGQLLEKKLEEMQLVTFTEPHGAFSPAGDGVALVIENARFETVYTDIKTGTVTRKVRVD